MTRLRSGLIAGVAAYTLWGLFPLYFPLLEPAAPVEILSHRMVWSLVFVLIVLAATTGFAWVKELGRRRAGLLFLAALMVSANWGVFIYGVNSDHVVETSLGYFINPLVTVALAVLLLKESLRPAQRVAVAIATVAVTLLTIDYGHVPWIALTLAFTFAAYGLLKKQAGVDGTQSLAVETGFLVLFALAYLVVIEIAGTGTFTTEGAGHLALLASAGVVTAIPLMLFGAAAIRIPLATLGLLQYIVPTLQFLIGVFVYDESMPASRLAGFGLVWIALIVLTYDAIRTARNERAADLIPEPAPV